VPFYRGVVTGKAPQVIPYWNQPPDLVGFGPQALRIADPTKSLVEGLNALYELKDLPELLEKDAYRLRGFRDLGDFSLVLNFGWVPFLSDLKAFDQAQEKMEKRIDQLLKDAGRPVRREFEIKHLNGVDESPIDAGVWDFPQIYPSFLTSAYASKTRWRLYTRTTTKYKFSGRCRYDLPSRVGFDTTQYRKMLRRRLYGFKITPKRLWKAIPWTWMVDWLGNVTDNLASIIPEVADRLVWDYAFLMRHVEQVSVLEQSFSLNTPSGPQEITVSTALGTSLKQREYAEPFAAQFNRGISGFEGLILGSLAASRKPTQIVSSPLFG